MVDDVVTRTVRVLRICLSVLRDVTVLGGAKGILNGSIKTHRLRPAMVVPAVVYTRVSHIPLRWIPGLVRRA